MEITRVALSCHFGSHAEFGLGPGDSKQTKMFIGQNIYSLNTCECQMARFLNVSLCDTLWVL